MRLIELRLRGSFWGWWWPFWLNSATSGAEEHNSGEGRILRERESLKHNERRNEWYWYLPFSLWLGLVIWAWGHKPKKITHCTLLFPSTPLYWTHQSLYWAFYKPKLKSRPDTPAGPLHPFIFFVFFCLFLFFLSLFFSLIFKYLFSEIFYYIFILSHGKYLENNHT